MKHVSYGILFCRLENAPGVGLRGAGGQKFNFTEHGHVAYQVKEEDDKNRIQVNFLPTWQTGDFWVGSKDQISLNSITKSISKIFIPNFVCVLTNKRYKNIERYFHSVAVFMPQGWDLGVLGVKNLSMGICNGAHRLCVIVSVKQLNSVF